MSGRVRLLLAACGWLCAAACQAAPDFAAERVSGDARYAAAWVLAGADNQDLPFAVVDKRDARIYVFEASGRLAGASAVLLGVTPGDFSVGVDRAPASLTLAERTTPAGRFDGPAGPQRQGRGHRLDRLRLLARDPPAAPRPAAGAAAGAPRVAAPRGQPDLRRLRRRAGRVLRGRRRADARQRPQRRLRAARIAPGERHVRGARPQPALRSAAAATAAEVSRAPGRRRHAGDADGLVFVAGAAGGADAAEHHARTVLDQHRAGLRQEASLRRRGEADEEVRVVLGRAAPASGWPRPCRSPPRPCRWRCRPGTCWRRLRAAPP